MANKQTKKISTNKKVANLAQERMKRAQAKSPKSKLASIQDSKSSA